MVHRCGHAGEARSPGITSGGTRDTRLVVLEFSSLEDARAWWESDEYRPLVELRRPPVADSRAFLVDGIDLGPPEPPAAPRATPPAR
jgi:uncharacterized protein (DUF1330 family)